MSLPLTQPHTECSNQNELVRGVKAVRVKQKKLRNSCLVLIGNSYRSIWALTTKKAHQLARANLTYWIRHYNSLTIQCTCFY